MQVLTRLYRSSPPGQMPSGPEALDDRRENSRYVVPCATPNGGSPRVPRSRSKEAGTTARRMVLGGRLRTSSSTAALTVPSPTVKSTLPPLAGPSDSATGSSSKKPRRTR
eukprot:scaffold76019_cov66-Phaeocystis_antarctica.AAC.6